MLRTDDIRRLLEVKDFNKSRSRRDSFGSNCSDLSDLSTQSMPQYSSYRALSGGLFGPFENSPSRPGSRSGFLKFKNKLSEMSHIPAPISRIKQPSVAKPCGTGEGSSRPSSRSDTIRSVSPAGSTPIPMRPSISRENSASKLPVFRRESSMPQIKRESKMPQMRRENSDIKIKPPATPRASAPVTPRATPRGTNVAITPQTTPKTVAARKISERNIAARGTRSGVSGVSAIIMIGDRVSITGTSKKGIVQFVGETKFAKGTWAGVVLDDATGKNDGSVAGVRYFFCPPLRGVFVKEEKLEKVADIRDPGFTPHGTAADKTSRMPSTSNVRNDSSMSSDSGVDVEHDFNIGNFVSITSISGTREGVLRYIGLTGFAKGTWCGVELREPNGKNDGAVAGTRYFQCESKHGIFAQIHKVTKLSSTSTSNLSTAVTTAEIPRRLSFKDTIDVTPTEDVKTQDVEQVVSSNIHTTPVDVVEVPSSIDSTSSSEQLQFDSHIAEQNKKIAALQLQLHKRNEEMQQLKEEHEKGKPHDNAMREYEETTLQLQTQVNQLAKEKLKLQNDVNESKIKIEDLQFQLEELVLLGADADKEGAIEIDLEKVIELEEKLHDKDKELNNLQSKLEQQVQEHEEGLAKLTEREVQLQAKDQEITKLRELLDVSKDHENVQNNEISNLKVQIQELRNLSASVFYAERKNENIEEEYEGKIFERDEKVAELQSQVDDLKNQLDFSQNNLTQKDTRITDLEYQLGKLRDEISETIESRDVLNKQIQELTTELSNKREEIQSLTEFTEELKKENLNLKCKSEALETRIEQLTEDKKKLEEDILQVSKNSGDNAQQLIHYNEQIQEKNSEITLLQDKLSTLTAEMHKSEQELADYKEKTEKEKQVHEKEKSDEINKLNDSLTTLEDHYKKIKLKNEEAEEEAQKEKVALQKSSNEINTLNRLNEEKAEQIKSSEKELEETRKQFAALTLTLKQQQVDLEQSSNELNSKHCEIETLNSEKQQLTSDNETMKTNNNKMMDELNNMKISKTELLKQYDSIVEENKNLIQEKEKISKDYEDILNKREQIYKEKEDVTSINDQLESEKLELSKRCSKLEEELKASSSNATKYEEEMNTVKKQISEGSTTVENLQLELSTLKLELESSTNKCNDLEATNVELVEKQLKMNNDREMMLLDIEKNKQNKTELLNEMSTLREQLKELLDRETTVRTGLVEDRNQLKTQVEHFSSNLTLLEGEAMKLRSKIQELEQKNSVLESKQKSMTQNKDTSQSNDTELNEVRASRDEKGQEVVFLNSIIIDLQKKNKECEDKIKLLTYGDDIESMEDMNNTMSPMKPGLRMRLFCDICDVFDLHDTEDCPTQSSDNINGSQHHGVRGEERPYCTVCETFGHAAESCDDEEMF